MDLSPKIFYMVTFCAVSASALSQNEFSGVYLTAEDFKDNKLTFRSPCPAKDDSIKFKDRSVAFELSMKDPRARNSFAVRTCHHVFRMQNNSRFKIINKTRISLYSKPGNVGGDGYFYEDSFFFSVKPDSEILPLTFRALESAYAENKKFVDLIKSSFKNEGKLITFNKHLNKYTLVYLYEKSLE